MNNRTRIFLDEAATKSLQQMIKDLRKIKGVSVSPSDLGSWIVEHFYTLQFEKQKREMAKRFTNFKKLVRDNLKSATTQEELLLSLKDSLGTSVAGSKAQSRVKTKPPMKSNVDELKDE